VVDEAHLLGKNESDVDDCGKWSACLLDPLGPSHTGRAVSSFDFLPNVLASVFCFPSRCC
jgi:hypothetical protein